MVKTSVAEVFCLHGWHGRLPGLIKLLAKKPSFKVVLSDYFSLVKSGHVYIFTQKQRVF
jgi:hypothetical protein